MNKKCWRKYREWTKKYWRGGEWVKNTKKVSKTLTSTCQYLYTSTCRSFPRGKQDVFHEVLVNLMSPRYSLFYSQFPRMPPLFDDGTKLRQVIYPLSCHNSDFSRDNSATKGRSLNREASRHKFFTGWTTDWFSLLILNPRIPPSERLLYF